MSRSSRDHSLWRLRHWRSLPVRFIETPVFTKELHRHLDDEEYRALQLSLVLRPDQGAVIPGSGGLRKLRWGAKGRGKRGGLRVIYYWAPAADVCLFIYVFAKNDQGDLTQRQTRLLARVAREEFE